MLHTKWLTPKIGNEKCSASSAFVCFDSSVLDVTDIFCFIETFPGGRFRTQTGRWGIPSYCKQYGGRGDLLKPTIQAEIRDKTLDYTTLCDLYNYPFISENSPKFISNTYNMRGYVTRDSPTLRRPDAARGFGLFLGRVFISTVVYTDPVICLWVTFVSLFSDKHTRPAVRTEEPHSHPCT